MKSAVFVMLFLLYVASLGAGVHQWTDAEGRVHFSDRPPAETAAVSQHSQRSTTATGPAATGGLRRGEERLLSAAGKRRQRMLAGRSRMRKNWHATRAKRRKRCQRTERELMKLTSLRSGWEKRRELLKERRRLRCFGGE